MLTSRHLCLEEIEISSGENNVRDRFEKVRSMLKSNKHK